MDTQETLKKTIFNITKVEKADNLNKIQYWTQEEDSLLLELVETEKQKGIKINWKNIAQNFNKDYKKCYSRYRQINPNLKKGYWTNDEEEKLKGLVNIYGKKWSKISKKLGTRSGKQIRHHYINITESLNNKLKFTQEDRNKLIELHKLHGSNWQLIATFFNGRTADNLKSKFYNYKKEKKVESNLNATTIEKFIKKRSLSSNNNIVQNIYATDPQINNSITKSNYFDINFTNNNDVYPKSYNEFDDAKSSKEVENFDYNNYVNNSHDQDLLDNFNEDGQDLKKLYNVDVVVNDFYNNNYNNSKINMEINKQVSNDKETNQGNI